MKKYIISINLTTEQLKENHPIDEIHTTYEVTKETNDRLYFKNRDLVVGREQTKYINKEYLNKVRGNLEYVDLKNGDYKTICNLSIYCLPDKQVESQLLIRSKLIEQAKILKEQADRFYKSFGHDEILEHDSPYIKVEHKSEVII